MLNRGISAFLGMICGAGIMSITYDKILLDLGKPLANNLGMDPVMSMVVKAGMSIMFAIVMVFVIITEPPKQNKKEVVKCSDVQDVEEVSEPTKSVT